jgi:hypothetical protein
MAEVGAWFFSFTLLTVGAPQSLLPRAPRELNPALGVISVFGLNPNGRIILNSDKGSAYTSSFFRKVCNLLNIRLITSASQYKYH